MRIAAQQAHRMTSSGTQMNGRWISGVNLKTNGVPRKRRICSISGDNVIGMRQKLILFRSETKHICGIDDEITQNPSCSPGQAKSRRRRKVLIAAAIDKQQGRDALVPEHFSGLQHFTKTVPKRENDKNTDWCTLMVPCDLKRIRNVIFGALALALGAYNTTLFQKVTQAIDHPLSITARSPTLCKASLH